MKSQVLHTVWCHISGEAAGEFWHWSLSGVKGLTQHKALAKWGHTVATTLRPAMLAVRGKMQQHCCVLCGHKKCFRRFSETFFVSRTQIFLPQMLHTWQNKSTFWETWSHQQCCCHNVSSFCRGPNEHPPNYIAIKRGQYILAHIYYTWGTCTTNWPSQIVPTCTSKIIFPDRGDSCQSKMAYRCCSNYKSTNLLLDVSDHATNLHNRSRFC